MRVIPVIRIILSVNQVSNSKQIMLIQIQGERVGYGKGALLELLTKNHVRI